jgi:hypothetical protein
LSYYRETSKDKAAVKNKNIVAVQKIFTPILKAKKQFEKN